MKSSYFIITILIVILLIQTCHGQSNSIIPAKCCDPMLMPVNGQCKKVECRNDDQCAVKYQSYCTKYNTGQSICRGISKICGCNKEDSNIEKNYNKKSCPVKQECKPDGKCGVVEKPKCTTPDTVRVNGQCQKVKCGNNTECKKFQSYCTSYNLGQPLCRSGNCGCGTEEIKVKKIPDPWDCPTGQKRYSNKKCGNISQQCANNDNMYVDGKCQKIKCKTQDECKSYQAYCTKYKLGQAMCHNGICECNTKPLNCPVGQELKPDGSCVIKCPVNQELYSDGKCGPIIPKCTDTLMVPVNGKCQQVKCSNDEQCAGFKSYCTKYKVGQVLCRGISGVCGCDGEESPLDKKPSGYCNYKLGDSDKCGKGNICLPSNRCGPPPKCAFYGEECHPKTNKCCDSSKYCHQRLGYSSHSCVEEAFVGDDCSSGIPCENGSYCIKGKCSLRKGDGCDFSEAVCPPNRKCVHTALRAGTNKICA